MVEYIHFRILKFPLTGQSGSFFFAQLAPGLLFMISGSNVLVLCLSIFLINSGQSWVAARCVSRFCTGGEL